jgi:hypothetical protein
VRPATAAAATAALAMVSCLNMVDLLQQDSRLAMTTLQQPRLNHR